MKRFIMTLLIFSTQLISPAQADWRWGPPNIKAHKVTYKCNSMTCLRQTYLKERKKLKRKIVRHNRRRLQEWKHWSRLFIPTCTWYGESGTGPQFATYRYTLPNSTGSGAFGKYQMMSGTYHNRAKYHDWSPLDQEIAGHKEYYANGTSPWTNC
jgi:hypothetical protein